VKPPDVATERPLVALFADLARQTASLMRQEVELAGTELAGKARSAGRGVVILGIGALIATMGGFALLAGGILALAFFIPLWLSALLVGGVVAGIGLAIALAGAQSLRQIDPAPRQTFESIDEDRQWLNQQLNR
jgi:hypothetical protein